MMLAEQPFLLASGTWTEVRKGNRTALAIFDRHYTSRRQRVRRVAQFLGPGETMVLLTPCARALFAWRRSIRDDGQTGVNCAVFRNEGAGLSSALIEAADALAFSRWPGERHFTHVDPREVRSTNPGFCFLRAGWRRCGSTASGLRILERTPMSIRAEVRAIVDEAKRIGRPITAEIIWGLLSREMGSASFRPLLSTMVHDRELMLMPQQWRPGMRGRAPGMYEPGPAPVVQLAPLRPQHRGLSNRQHGRLTEARAAALAWKQEAAR